MSHWCLAQSKDIIRKTLILGKNSWENDSSGDKKCPQGKILMLRMDTCPEGSMWQDPASV
jgi:hypothetical protein